MAISQQQLQNAILTELNTQFGSDFEAFILSRIDEAVAQVITEIIDERLKAKVKEILTSKNIWDKISRNIDI
jgi:hypothetical protein